ncbi:MAG TPA: hypothetical protein VFP59_03365 [Candidatus Angelobacter sp.]|nr:hypothetical protein [Candidatus Angelobacter sp.]
MRILAFVLAGIFSSFAPTQMASINPPQKPAAHAQKNTAPEARESAAARDEDIQALRQDVARMKVLVQQMQSNLAFVDTTQSPLKHEFELNIEMWQTIIAQMDRRLQQASREPASRK